VRAIVVHEEGQRERAHRVASGAHTPFYEEEHELGAPGHMSRVSLEELPFLAQLRRRAALLDADFQVPCLRM
jgi:hypothetical protein